jgi:hypothetical protein
MDASVGGVVAMGVVSLDRFRRSANEDQHSAKSGFACLVQEPAAIQLLAQALYYFLC